MNKHQQSKDNKLTEGLRKGDLKDIVDPQFTVDQFQSKMGNDKDIIVLRFRTDKEPAIDLMEFIEKGYEFILDADTSSGEERDGRHSVFIELERDEKAPANVKNLINGVSQLCDNTEWRFRWYKDTEGHDFSEEEFAKVVPLTPEDYLAKSDQEDKSEVSSFFDQGALDGVEVGEDRIITFNKIFAESLTAKFVAIGKYHTLKESLKGPLQLDDASRAQVVYLNKYLGNYDINKIEDKFLIRNGDEAVILAKDKW